MLVIGYISEYWGLLVILIGTALVLHSDVHLERRMVRRIFASNIMLFAYSITTFTESYFGDLDTLHLARPILSAINYSLVTFILVNSILIMYPMQKRQLFIPAYINALLCFVSIPTGVVFYYTDDNHFQRGMLGYLPYFINALYLVYLFYRLFHSDRMQREDMRVLIFVVITSILCLVLPLFYYNASSLWFTMTIAGDILLYYVFLLQQFTKRDSLTKLLDRQSYYSDLERYSARISSLIAIDMNGLKEINDSAGHIAGDAALVALADCFWKAAHDDQRVYRIGGDEFVILCIGGDRKDAEDLITRIRENVGKTGYTCAIGMAMRPEAESLELLYQLADRRLYEEKSRFYEATGKTRRKREHAAAQTAK